MGGVTPAGMADDGGGVDAERQDEVAEAKPTQCCGLCHRWRRANPARTEAECEGFGPKAQMDADGMVHSFWPRSKKYDGQGCPKFSEGPR